MFLDSDNWTLQNVYLRPNRWEGVKGKEGQYWPVDRMDPDNPVVRSHSGPRDLYMSTKGKAMRQLGCSEEEIEEACAAWMAGYQGPEAG